MNGNITVVATGGTPPYTYSWVTLHNVSAGTYTDTITDNNGCKKVFTFTINMPSPLFVQIDSIPSSCLGSCDGQLTCAVTGGTPFIGAGGLPYYHYQWNTTPPQYTESITGLCEGIYNLTITDSNGCRKIINNYLGVNDSISATFTASPTSSSSPWIVNFTFTGTTSPANNYKWTFGDGGTSNLENPTHTYATFATYDVWLYVTNGVCKDSFQLFIGPASLGKLNTALNDLISIYPNPVKDNLQIQSDLIIKTMKIADITGRLLFTTTSKTIDCSSLSEGLYFIRVTTEKGMAVKKFIKIKE